MIHRSSSIQEVIGRVIRNTRIQDSSYIIDMQEWIPEAMGYMRTRMEQIELFDDVTIHFHKGKLPCGLIDLAAVEYCGTRLKYSNTVKHYQTGHNFSNGGSTDAGLFVSVITEKVLEAGENSYMLSLVIFMNLCQAILHQSSSVK